MIFTADWLDRGISTSEELKATTCLLGIDVGGRRVSRFFDDRTGRADDAIPMPAYIPAEFLARKWWSLIGGRTGSIAMRPYREGYAVPDLRFSPDGRYVDVSVEPCTYENPPVAFPWSAKARVAVADFERDIAAFVAIVAERLTGCGQTETWLQERWAAIEASRADADERWFCEAAGALGLDPYVCDDEAARLIEATAELFADEALLELLAGSSVEELERTNAWVVDAERRLGEKAVLPDLADVGPAVRADVSLYPRPWETGYRAAAACRAKLGIRAGRVFPGVKEIAELFGSTRFEVAEGRPRGLRAEANGAAERPRVVVGNFSAPTSRSFAMMRAIGDFVVYGERGRAPVTDTYSYRQAVGRAFAVEMLAPAEIIVDMYDAGNTVEEIAALRHVSEIAVERHLANSLTLTAA